MLQIWFFQVSQSKMHQKSSGRCKKKLGADVTLGLDFDKIGQKAKETGEMPNPPQLDAKKQIN